MAFTRVKSLGWPTNGSTVDGWLTSTQLNQLDIDHVNAVDRINGDTIAGPIVLASTGGIVASCPVVITGAGSQLVTSSGGRIRLGNDGLGNPVYPKYSTPRTFQRIRPFLVQQGPTFQWVVNLNTSTTSTIPGLTGNVDLSDVLVDGSVLTSIDIAFAVGGSHTSPPVVTPKFTLYQQGLTTGALTVVATASIPAPVSGTAWNAGGAAQFFTLPVASLTIDRKATTYYLQVIDESGANALTGNVYQSLRLTYSCADMRPA